jgi:hypothetical protein
MDQRMTTPGAVAETLDHPTLSHLSGEVALQPVVVPPHRMRTL